MEEPELLQDDSVPGGSPEEILRRAEEAMEQMLLAQEEDESLEDDDVGGNAFLDDNHRDDEFGNNEFVDERLNMPFANVNHAMNTDHDNAKENPISYVKASFLAAFVLVFYAFRTRQQWYLALVFLSSSKWAYIILGNALIAFLIHIFQLFTKIFMDGLRLAEAEGLGDFFRWNVTETCLALTIFRAELTVKTGVLFLIFVLAKCLHWVADMREGHLRMTEEAVVALPNSTWPGLRWAHVKLLLCLFLLQLLDILAVIRCGHDIVQNGPSVSILFAFEGAIMLTSVVSNVLLWHLHFLDGLFHYVHESTVPSHLMHRWIHPWKDHKATLVFAVEVQAQACKFLFYITFFAIVMTYYGLPINLIREVYISFQALKQRLVAFKKYRQLMASMNRFQNPSSEELEEEHTCIICRDEMTVETSKRLPGCGHIMHKSCLREWLVQQQTCPTCRGDISAMEARQRQQELIDARNQQNQQQVTEEEKDDSSRCGPELSTTSTGISAGAAVDNSPPPESKGTETENSKASVDQTRQKEKSSFSNLVENMDKKPSAMSANRGKRVRIVTPGATMDSFHDDFLSNVERSAFPAFYRVVQDAGAAVYNDGQAVSFVIRVVPFGVVVLGQEMAWRSCDGENQMMIRIPDGWISDDHLERIVAVPFES